MQIEKRSVFLVLLPQVTTCGVLLSQCWLVFTWLDGLLPFVEVSGESPGRLVFSAG